MSASTNTSVDPETPISNVGTPVDAVKTEEKSEETTVPTVDFEKARKSFQDKAQSYLVSQTRPVVIPSFAKWFDMNSIHDLEKQLFPDFFQTDASKKSIYKTENSYKYSRDFIINCYRLNPIEYLTITAVRRNLAGDVTSIIRIHQFLEKWGLINYQVDPRTKSTSVGPQYTGHFQITLDAPKGLVPFIPESYKITNPPSNVKGEDDIVVDEEGDASVDDATLKEIPLNLEVRRNVYNDSQDNQKLTGNQYICSVTGKDISEVRYYNLKSKGAVNNPNSSVNNASYISEECFEQGLFPSNFQSSNFVKFSKELDLESWSQQEVLLLLEAIEMYGSYDLLNETNLVQANSNGNEQWNRISEHVGTKSKEQCVLKFIQLPIEDRFLNKLIEKNPKNELGKESIVQEIAAKLIKESEGAKVLSENAKGKLQDLNKEELELIKQISELTLEKVNLKLNSLKSLETNLIDTENKLNLERKRLAIERWIHYEKIYKFKQANTNPELASLLDDLLSPVGLQEIDASTKKKIDFTDNNEVANNAGNVDNLPVSVTQPETYKFWSG